MTDELNGDGVGGAVLEVLTGNAFRLLVSHTRKDNKGDYGKTEKIYLWIPRSGREVQGQFQGTDFPGPVLVNPCRCRQPGGSHK